MRETTHDAKALVRFAVRCPHYERRQRRHFPAADVQAQRSVLQPHAAVRAYAPALGAAAAAVRERHVAAALRLCAVEHALRGGVGDNAVSGYGEELAVEGA
jgi:hypothetical protein